MRERLFKRLLDGDQHRLGVLQQVMVPKAKHSEALRRKPSRAALIGAPLFRMLSTIQLHHHLFLEADEVRGADDLLPPKLVPCYLPRAKVSPQAQFRVGEILAQPDGEFFGYRLHSDQDARFPLILLPSPLPSPTRGAGMMEPPHPSPPPPGERVSRRSTLSHQGKRLQKKRRLHPGEKARMRGLPSPRPSVGEG